MTLARRHLPALAAGLVATPALAQGPARVLRYVPSSDLFTLDFIWSSSAVALTSSLMVYDCLYGLDPGLNARPQMVAGQELSNDQLRWTFTLRENLAPFSTGERVTAADCVASIARWAQRRPIGQRLTPVLEEMRALDDRRFEIRLKRPFPQLLRGLTEPWVMPERLAKTSAFTEVKEIVGSGPYVFLRDEWVSGARAAFRRNEAYAPRDEPPSYLSGGKRVHLDRVEWTTMPDGASAAAALQRGEIDYMERPLFDLMPRLRRTSGIVLKKTDALGWSAYLHFNNAAPPFDNVALRRTVIAAMDQADFMQAAVGDASLYHAGIGIFTPGGPYETKAGMETLPARDPPALRRAVQESGYKGEKVVLMIPTDTPHLNAMGLVAQQVMEKLGLIVEAQFMDLGTLFGRWRGRDKTDQNTWSCFPLTWQGVGTATPASHVPILGQAPDPEMVRRVEAWFQAPDAAAERSTADAIQRRYYEAPPMGIMGGYVWPVAFRSNVQDAQEAPFTVFWGVRKT